MGAFLELSKFFSKGIVEHAISLGYSKANILILNGDIVSLQNEFPNIYNNLISCKHHRDRRTPLEYGQDLVASWLFEDSMVISLRNCGLDISLAGADSNREILSNTSVSANSDCSILKNGINYQLEIMCDYTGYWERTGNIDLRDSKYNKLISSNSLFLGISTPTMKYILIDFGANVPAKYISSHLPYGGKPAYSVHVLKTNFKHLNITKLANEINNFL